MPSRYIAQGETTEKLQTMTGGKGARIRDQDGREFIDFTSGWNVVNLGWNHPEVSAALEEQAKKNVYVPFWALDPIQEEYAKELTASFSEGLDACLKATGGMEAIEEALKIARVYTKKRKIIGFTGSYHGQSFSALALGSKPEEVEKIRPLVPDILRTDFPDARENGKELDKFLTKLEKRLRKKDIAAVVTEPGIITGSGEMICAPEGYLQAVQQLTHENEALLIVDEVGTGFSRTGALFAIEHENVVPDMVCLGKGISNGAAAIGAVVGRSSIFNRFFEDARISSTFGWTSVACAAALAVLRVHHKENTAEQARDKGARIVARLKEEMVQNSNIVDIRGRGLELGIELKEGLYQDVVDYAFEHGLYLTGNETKVIQLMPPLTIPEDVLEEGLEILVKALRSPT